MPLRDLPLRDRTTLLQGPGRTARHATTRERGIVFADHTRTHAKKDCPSAQTSRMLKSSHRPPQRNCPRTPLSNSVTLPSSCTSSERSCSTPTRPDHASVSAGDLVTDGPRPDHTSDPQGDCAPLVVPLQTWRGYPPLCDTRTRSGGTPRSESPQEPPRSIFKL